MAPMPKTFITPHGAKITTDEAASHGIIITPPRLSMPISRHESEVFDRARADQLPKTQDAWRLMSHTWVNPGFKD